jgi:hypothetical protein
VVSRLTCIGREVVCDSTGDRSLRFLVYL